MSSSQQEQLPIDAEQQSNNDARYPSFLSRNRKHVMLVVGALAVVGAVMLHSAALYDGSQGPTASLFVPLLGHRHDDVDHRRHDDDHRHHDDRHHDDDHRDHDSHHDTHYDSPHHHDSHHDPHHDTHHDPHHDTHHDIHHDTHHDAHHDTHHETNHDSHHDIHHDSSHHKDHDNRDDDHHTKKKYQGHKEKPHIEVDDDVVVDDDYHPRTNKKTNEDKKHHNDKSKNKKKSNEDKKQHNEKKNVKEKNVKEKSKKAKKHKKEESKEDKKIEDKKKKEDKKNVDEILPPPQTDCDALLTGVFYEDCINDMGSLTGRLAVTKTYYGGVVGIGSTDDGSLGLFVFEEWDPEVPNPMSNCKRQATLSIRDGPDDWASAEGDVLYNAVGGDNDKILWSFDGGFCTFTKLTGSDCEDTLKDIFQDFKDEKEFDLELYSGKDLC